jgi:hypothetical protein
MLEIILIASGSFLAAMFCVWVYRVVKAWHESRFRTVKLEGQGRRLDVGHQQGTVELKLNGSRMGMASSTSSRKPWGW